MYQKRFFMRLVFLFSTLFFVNLLNAAPPIIEVVDRSDAALKRLSITGRTETQSHQISIRTLCKEDITRLDETPGPLSQAFEKEQIKHDFLILSGENIHDTLKDYYKVIWEPRLKSGPHYDPTLLYILEDEEKSEGSKFMGHFSFAINGSQEWGFSLHIMDAYKRKGIASHIGSYLLTEFIPGLQSHPLTSEKARLYKTVRFTLSDQNPHAEKTKKLVRQISEKHILSIPQVDSKPFERQYWTINLEKFYKKPNALDPLSFKLIFRKPPTEKISHYLTYV